MDQTKLKSNKNLTLKILPVFLLIITSTVLNAQELLQLGSNVENSEKIIVVTNRAITMVDNDHFIAEPRYDQEGVFTYFTAYDAKGAWSFTREESIGSMLKNDFEFNDWLVFVHGDSKTLLDAVKRAEEIKDLHHVNVLVYSWPSKDPELSPIANFKKSYNNVEHGTAYFKDFLVQLNELKIVGNNPLSAEKMTLFLHSLGNYFMKQLVAENLQVSLDESLFNNLILNAAAVEEKDHHLWVEQLNFSVRTYINSNDDDISLTGLRMLTSLGLQLGEKPKEPFAKNAIYVNFTDAVGFPGSMGPSHSYYFSTITEKSKNIKEYYTSIFHGEAAQLENTKLFAQIPPNQQSYTIKF